MSLSDTVATFWISALVDGALKGSVLLMCVAGIDALWLRRRPASARHLAWTLAVSAALLQAPLAALVPAWHVPVSSFWSTARGASTSRPAATARVADADTAGAIPGVSSPTGAGAIQSIPARHADMSSTIRARSSGRETTWTRVRGSSWPAAIFWAWAAGAMLLLVRLIASHGRVAWLVRRSRPAPAPVRELGYASARAIDAPPTELRLSATAMPSACGVWRRSVLLPADAMSWSLERLRLVLLHELAHVRRRDCLVQAIAELACAVYWFNPLMWIGARRLQQERERACDDCVLAAGAKGTDYAEHLIDIARMLRSSRTPLPVRSSVAMAHRSQLEGRLLAILDPGVPRARVGGASAVCACAVTMLFAVPLAALRPGAEPATASTRPSPAAQPVARHTTPAVAIAERPPVHLAVTPTRDNERQQGTAPVTAAARDDMAVVAARHAAVSVDITRGTSQAASAIVAETVQPMHMQADSPASTDPRIVAALTAAMKDTDADVRRTAMSALMRVHSPEVFGALAAAVRDTDADVRQQAVFALGQLRDARAMPLLTTAAADAAADVRRQAVFALGQLGDPAAHDALAAALRDPKPDVRRNAAFALGQLHDPRGTAALVPALKDTDSDVRQQAAFALGQLRDPSAVDALIGAVRDGVPDVRGQALFALGQIRDPRAIDVVTAALKDGDAKVRAQAAFALSQLVH